MNTPRADPRLRSIDVATHPIRCRFGPGDAADRGDVPNLGQQCFSRTSRLRELCAVARISPSNRRRGFLGSRAGRGCVRVVDVRKERRPGAALSTFRAGRPRASASPAGPSVSGGPPLCRTIPTPCSSTPAARPLSSVWSGCSPSPTAAPPRTGSATTTRAGRSCRTTCIRSTGMPLWVIWGFIVPWGICAVFTFWFTGFFMADDDLGAVHATELESDIREGGPA